jgi:hypothetical protein
LLELLLGGLALIELDRELFAGLLTQRLLDAVLSAISQLGLVS